MTNSTTNTQANDMITQEEMDAMNDMMNDNDWLMQIDSEVPHTASAPVSPVARRVAGGRPTLSQIVQLTATTVTKTILDEYKRLEAPKAAMAAIALIRTMYSVNKVASVECYTKAAIELSKYTNSKNNDKKMFHIKVDGVGIIKLATQVGYITIEDDVVTPTEKWNNMMVSHVPMSPSTCPISSKKEDRLRKNIMKSNCKASKVMREAVHFLEATEYSVNKFSFTLAGKVLSNCEQAAHQQVMEGKPAVFNGTVLYKIQYRAALNAMFPEEMQMVIQGCELIKDEEQLWSEYDADARGRLYHVMCFGPNPQASDIARAMYSLNIEVAVKQGTPAYDHFLLELSDIGGGKFDSHKARMAVAEQPEKALTKWMSTKCDAPKKPFSYVRMCQTYAQFELHGEATCTMGYGLDAKCSGTQYLAFIAGDINMSEATGLTDSQGRKEDPYMQSLGWLYKECPQYVAMGLDRAFIKTPYMAVQYGGGAGALTGSKDFIAALKERGITAYEQVDQIAKDCVAAIKCALGAIINNFIKEVAESVIRKCQALGKDFFQYKHTDGQKVRKPGYGKVEMSQTFIIRIEEGEQMVFGQLDDEGKPTGAWVMESRDMSIDEFARTFVVNYIQGIDALVARTFIVEAKKAGLRGLTSIHDCFRCCLADVPQMMEVIRRTYEIVFVESDQLEHLRNELDYSITQERADEIQQALRQAEIAIYGECPEDKYSFSPQGVLMHFSDNVVTKELLNHENAYYFCI